MAGFVFSIESQNMEYLGENRSTTMQWYWLGAILSYGLSLASIITMLLKLNSMNNSGLDYILRTTSTLLIMVSFTWTTFIIIAWQSGV